MNTVRLNITLPADVADMLKNVKNKSAFIAESIRAYVKQEEKKRLTEALKEGYIATKKEDKELSNEWIDTIGDGID
ncbi:MULTISPECIES: hypothetical protein [Deferribacter]|uniref:CopG family transcriptional regulator n=1 Tax=Deferribacter autotrophicus TaxID=500465 RepID=A0A5A8F1D9_9BACT|nr:hypothetical protein [Deferribacter autotrophicus]KAA0257502.1 hypothetical protein FHQ18_09170 [Deferribacter autotrophicus]